MSDPLGLLSGPECDYLREVGRGVVVEVGSLGGLSACCLARGASVVHCFDTFRLEEANPAYANALGLAPDFVGSFRGVFEKNTRKWRDKIVVHEGDALEGAWDTPIDVLFIDASSGWRLQRGLVDKFYRHLKKGGLLIHQDFFYNRSPYLAPLMARLAGSFEIVKNVDTSMVYRRGADPITDDLEIDVYRELPAEIGRFGGIHTIAGAVLTTALIYWMRENGRDNEARDLTIMLVAQQKGQRVWENLREAWA